MSAPRPSEPLARRAIGGVVAALALSSAAAIGCGDETRFSLAFETAHFRYHVAEGVTPPCGETAQWLERDYQAFSEFLGVSDGPGVKMDYYLYGGEDAVRAHCGGNASACTDHASIYSWFPVDDHELVHAIGSYVGYPPYLFQEGLATMLGSRSPNTPGQRSDPWEPLERLTTTTAFITWVDTHGFHVYAAATKLVRMLCDRFGTEAFMAFYGSLPVYANAVTISAAARLRFGESIETLIEEMRALPPTYYDESARHVMPCHEAKLVAGAEVDVPLVCARNGIGAEAVVAFSAGAAPTELLFDGVTVDIEILRCEGGTLTDAWTHVDPSDPEPRGARVVLDVPPGDYVATVHALVPGPMIVRSIPSAVTFDRRACTADRGAIELAPGYPVIVASRWRTDPCAGAPWCPGLAWDVLPTTTGQVDASGLLDEVPNQLYACPASCPADPTAACTAQPVAAATAPVRLPAMAASPLHLGADHSSNDSFFALVLRLLPP